MKSYLFFLFIVWRIVTTAQIMIVSAIPSTRPLSIPRLPVVNTEESWQHIRNPRTHPAVARRQGCACGAGCGYCTTPETPGRCALQHCCSCDHGYYRYNGACECTICNHGFYQPTGFSNAEQCEPWITCNQGERFIDGSVIFSGSCVNCTSGQYQDAQIHQESLCKLHTHVMCGPGEQYNNGTAYSNPSCTSCPEGQYQDSKQHNAMCKPQPWCRSSERMNEPLNIYTPIECLNCSRGTTNGSPKHRNAICLNTTTTATTTTSTSTTITTTITTSTTTITTTITVTIAAMTQSELVDVPPNGAVAGGVVAGLVVIGIIVFILHRKAGSNGVQRNQRNNVEADELRDRGATLEMVQNPMREQQRATVDVYYSEIAEVPNQDADGYVVDNSLAEPETPVYATYASSGAPDGAFYAAPADGDGVATYAAPLDTATAAPQPSASPPEVGGVAYSRSANSVVAPGSNTGAYENTSRA